MISERRTYIIAEVGVNHNGSVDLAKKLIYVAANAGADAVKFQTFKTGKLTSRTAAKAEYQEGATGDNKESQFNMLQRYELSVSAHDDLFEYCSKIGIQFLSTPFDDDSLDLLVNRFNLPMVKIASGEITNAPLLLKTAQTGRHIILSTGMSSLAEVEIALGVLAFGYTGKSTPSMQAFCESYFSSEGQYSLREKVTLLHCTTEYPALYEDTNLRAMETMRMAFRLRVGLSDHTPGIEVSLAAVARGAAVIEKHFTLDKNMPGPDHKASLEPLELGQLVKSIRNVEMALGSTAKIPTVGELKNRAPARKSIVAVCDIRKGEIFTEANLTVKRPGTGISPMNYWDWLGKRAKRNYKKDEVIT